MQGLRVPCHLLTETHTGLNLASVYVVFTIHVSFSLLLLFFVFFFWGGEDRGLASVSLKVLSRQNLGGLPLIYQLLTCVTGLFLRFVCQLLLL